MLLLLLSVSPRTSASAMMLTLGWALLCFGLVPYVRYNRFLTRAPTYDGYDEDAHHWLVEPAPLPFPYWLVLAAPGGLLMLSAMLPIDALAIRLVTRAFCAIQLAITALAAFFIYEASRPQSQITTADLAAQCAVLVIGACGLLSMGPALLCGGSPRLMLLRLWRWVRLTYIALGAMLVLHKLLPLYEQRGLSWELLPQDNFGSGPYFQRGGWFISFVVAGLSMIVCGLLASTPNRRRLFSLFRRLAQLRTRRSVDHELKSQHRAAVVAALLGDSSPAHALRMASASFVTIRFRDLDRCVFDVFPDLPDDTSSNRPHGMSSNTPQETNSSSTTTTNAITAATTSSTAVTATAAATTTNATTASTISSTTVPATAAAAAAAGARCRMYLWGCGTGNVSPLMYLWGGGTGNVSPLPNRRFSHETDTDTELASAHTDRVSPRTGNTLGRQEQQQQLDATRSRAVATPLGECDAFVSHSSQDPPQDKYDALQRWALDRSSGTNGGGDGSDGGGDSDAPGGSNRRDRPDHGSNGGDASDGMQSLWIDRICLEALESSPATTLPLLPIFVASCRQLLAIAGPSFSSRLWCALEVFAFVQMRQDAHQQRAIVVLPLGDDPAADLFRGFDIRKARCLLKADAHAIKAIIESTFGELTSFNRVMRELACARTHQRNGAG